MGQQNTMEFKNRSMNTWLGEYEHLDTDTDVNRKS